MPSAKEIAKNFKFLRQELMAGVTFKVLSPGFDQLVSEVLWELNNIKPTFHELNCHKIWCKSLDASCGNLKVAAANVAAYEDWVKEREK